ncbi:hypothetical protein HGI30_16635 [Paenibacillus albicereus]|uniref:DUF3990 domain-containing protein n=1 Tax=Paenibacillus albicereus TaxID=2726185 RepID=A0A6H2H046_9BACL|nr:hypothetical protein [Paenibacillus albicereus]QJC53040.1 hypothetical protein HGI30_16635 [Paenibacillus albicereus]
MQKRSSVLLLHHGTNDRSSENIRSVGFKIFPETREDHWLGPGVYFFREDEEQALTWARTRYKYDQDTIELHVLEMEIVVQDENFLNLDSRSGLEKLNQHLNSLGELLEQSGAKPLNLDENRLRHLVMKLLPTHIYVIKRTFPGASRFDKVPALAAMRLRSHGVQVCIRSEKAIDMKSVRIINVLPFRKSKAVEVRVTG